MADGEKNVRTADGSAREIKRKGTAQDLNQAATLASWATPTTRDWKDGASTLENTPINGLLGRQVSLASWPTPDAYPRGGPQQPDKKKAGGHAVSLQDAAYGTISNGSHAATEKRGQIRPSAAGSWAIRPRGTPARLRQRDRPSSRGSIHQSKHERPMNEPTLPRA